MTNEDTVPYPLVLAFFPGHERTCVPVPLRPPIGVVFEDRPPKYLFGALNYGDVVPPYINGADGDPWDVFAPGYDRRLSFERTYLVSGVMGVFHLENGNHKIAVRLREPGFDTLRAEAEIGTYCRDYSRYTGVRGRFFPDSEGGGRAPISSHNVLPNTTKPPSPPEPGSFRVVASHLPS